MDTDELLRPFGRHLVGLAGVYQPIDATGKPNSKPVCFFYSGFVIRICGSWWWATAGHNIDCIESKVRAKRIIVEGTRLIDRYGTGSDRNHYVPFDYEGARKIYSWNEKLGIDYGLVQITPFYAKMLRANEVAPIPKKEWSDQDRLQFDAHFMLGLPEDDHVCTVVEDRDGYIVTGNARPSAIHVKKLARPRQDLQTSKYPRFIGKLTRYKTGSIVGMSGGPIFGLASTGECRIVALQSTWLPKERITFGFPVSVLAKLAEAELKAIP